MSEQYCYLDSGAIPSSLEHSETIIHPAQPQMLEQRNPESSPKVIECILYYYKFDSRITKMVSVLQNKLLYRSLQSTFDQIFLASCMPIFRINTQEHITSHLSHKIETLSKTISNKLKQNSCTGFYRIMNYAVASDRNCKIQQERIDCESSKVQCGVAVNIFSETDIGSQNSNRDHQPFISSIEKLLSDHSGILESSSKKHIHKRSISPITLLSPISEKNRIQMHKSKDKHDHSSTQ